MYSISTKIIEDILNLIQNAIGDAGAAPVNTEGETVLNLLTTLRNNLTEYVLQAHKRFYIYVEDLTVAENQKAFIPSGVEVAVKNLIVDGYLRIDGTLIAENATLNGTIEDNGVFEINL